MSIVPRITRRQSLALLMKTPIVAPALGLFLGPAVFLGPAIEASPAFGAKHARVGKTRFRLKMQSGPSDRPRQAKLALRRYIHIHGNETTARTTLAQHLTRRGGSAVYVESATRSISVESLAIDPNRMFSRIGAEASLQRLNPNAPSTAIQKALDRIQRDLPSLLRLLTPASGGLLISVHNNSQGYNIQEEIPLSERHHLPLPAEPNNFFLCTDPRDFEILAMGPFNAVLQQNPPSPDDGSLSRWCAGKGIRYINLEAILGAAARQLEMLAWLDDSIPSVHPQ
jgi:hypothetical protein